MKIGILSDCHLGMKRFRKMIDGQNAWKRMGYDSFMEACNVIIEEHCDAVLIAGDLFDSSNPDVESFLKAREGLAMFHGLPIVGIGGNHEWESVQNGHPLQLMSDMGDFFFDKMGEVTIGSGGEYVEVIALPYGVTPHFGFSHSGILLMHGFLDDSPSSFALPKSVAALFDTVICGHIHIGGHVKTKGLSVLTPGSTMPTNFKCEPSVCILDTMSGSVIRKSLKSAPLTLVCKTADANVANDALMSVKPRSLVYVEFYGLFEDLNAHAYKKALENSLSLTVQTQEANAVYELENVDESFEDFWTFIREKYPAFYDEFKEVIDDEAG